MNSRMFFAAAAVLSVIVLAALSAALPSALLPGNTAYAQTNSAPQFPSSETGTRTVDENTPWYQNIGDPVVATDPDDDKLTYSLKRPHIRPGKRPHIPLHHRQVHGPAADRRSPGLRDPGHLHG